MKSQLSDLEPHFYIVVPEGWVKKSGHPEIDGKKFDIWSLECLAFEIFTKMSLLHEVSKRKLSLLSWYDDLYPLMRDNLQKDRFAVFMCSAFPNSHDIDENAGKVISFIKFCLIVVPEKRPSINVLQQHEVFGGSFKKVDMENEEDIWNNRADDLQSSSNSEIKNLESQPENIANKCNNTNEINAVTHSEEIADAKEKEISMKSHTPDKKKFLKK